jgi:iron(III) transport system substrate-binding protein
MKIWPSHAFKDKLCLRTSKKVYNQSLVAMLMATHGEAKTEQIVKGWVSNLPIVPFADDTKLLEAIADPQAPCAVGIANTYYFGRFVEKQPTASVKIFWPNQQKVKGQLDGVHVNVAGAGVTKHAKNKAEAIKLLEWLSSAKAQNLFADSNLEYPVNPTIKTDATVAAWGTFKQSVINVDKAGQLQAKATMLMDRAGYR